MRFLGQIARPQVAWRAAAGILDAVEGTIWFTIHSNSGVSSRTVSIESGVVFGSMPLTVRATLAAAR